MTSSRAQQWADDDLATLDLGDERRNRRARKMVERIAQRPGALITAVFEGKRETDAAYRLLNNPAVAPDEIRAALQRGTVERLVEIEVVLAPQDTTCLDFSGHPATAGLGPTGGPNASGHGMFVHSAIAVSVDGVPFGLLHQQDWARDPEQTGKSRDRKQLPIEEKESHRWVETVRAVEAAVPADKLLIQICGSLHEAHQNGIVHRDLKPDNIMLVPSRNAKDLEEVPKDPWNREFQYVFPAKRSSSDYDVYSLGRDGVAAVASPDVLRARRMPHEADAVLAQVLDRFQDGLVLDGRGQDVAAVGRGPASDSEDGEVVRLGSARGEDDLVGLGCYGVGDLAAGSGYQLCGVLAVGVGS